MASQIKHPPCLDISYWTIVEWDSLTPLPWFIYAKASEGFQSTVGAFKDPRFLDHARNIKRKGIRRGAYHFLRPGDIGNQAEFFKSVLVEADFGALDIPILDWEDEGNTLADSRQWLEHVERVTGQHPLIYSSALVVERLYDGKPVPSWFKEYKWILAGYPLPDADRFDVIPEWYIPRGLSLEHVAMWQYEANGVYTGIQGNKNDLNWMNPDWMESIHLTAPEGGTVTTYIFSITPTNTTGSKVRPEPDTGNVPLPTSLPFGKYAYGNRRVSIAEDKWEVINGANVQVNRAGDIWLEVMEVNGTLFTVPAYIAEIHLGVRYARITQLSTPPVDPPPTGTLPDLPVTITLGDDITYARQTVNVVLKPKSTG